MLCGCGCVCLCASVSVGVTGVWVVWDTSGSGGSGLGLCACDPEVMGTNPTVGRVILWPDHVCRGEPWADFRPCCTPACWGGAHRLTFQVHVHQTDGPEPQSSVSVVMKCKSAFFADSDVCWPNWTVTPSRMMKRSVASAWLFITVFLP